MESLLHLRIFGEEVRYIASEYNYAESSFSPPPGLISHIVSLSAGFHNGEFRRSLHFSGECGLQSHCSKAKVGTTTVHASLQVRNAQGEYVRLRRCCGAPPHYSRRVRFHERHVSQAHGKKQKKTFGFRRFKNEHKKRCSSTRAPLHCYEHDLIV